MTVNFAGHVYNDAGSAISGASVKLLETGTTTQEGSTVTTDSNGAWAFTEADQDRYDVEITKGSSVRRIRWDDQISLKEIDVRNNSAAGTPAATFTNLTNNAANQVAVFSGANSTRADGDEIYLSFKLADSAGNLDEFARMTAEATDVTSGSEDGQIRFGVIVAGTLTDVFTINSTTGGAAEISYEVDSFTIKGGEGEAGVLYLFADQGDDAGDEWKVNVADGGVLTIGNDIASAGSYVTMLTITPHATTASSSVAIAGDATVGDDLTLTSDSSVLGFGADTDTTLTHTDGTGLTLNSTNKLTFGDATSFIQQSADGTLRIDGEAIIDLNASTRVDVSGDIKVGGEVQTASIGFTDGDNAITIADGGAVTFPVSIDVTGSAGIILENDETITNSSNGVIAFSGNITVPNAGTIGSAGDTDSIAIASDGVVTMNQIPVFSAGINVSGGTIAGTLATAAQGNVTSLGTLTALTIDDVAVDGKVVTMTGSSSDTAVFTAGTNGTLSIVTTDAAAAAANIQITADGTAELAGTTVTLDSAGDITLDADGADVVFKDGGTTIATLTNSSSDFVITTGVQDKDFIVKGDDGGGAITALTLDMSEAGNATFNGRGRWADGTAGGPSFSFSADTNTGMYRSNIDTVTIATAGAAVVSFTAAQKLDLLNNDLLNVGNANNEWDGENLTLNGGDAVTTLTVETEGTDKDARIRLKTAASSTQNNEIYLTQGDGSGSANNMQYVLAYGGDNAFFKIRSYDVDGSATNGDILRIEDGGEEVRLTTGLGSNFDYVCETCGEHQAEPFMCHGVQAPWHDDVASLAPVLAWAAGQKDNEALQHFADLGVLSLSTDGEGVDKKPWIGINVQTAQWFTWAAMQQMYQKNRELESRLVALGG